MATDWNVWGTIKQAAGLWFRKDGYALKVTPTGTTLTADRTINLPNANADTTLATIDGIQTLTNKDIDGGTASASNKLKLPEDTYANLVALAGKTEGQIFYANDIDKVLYYNGTTLIEVGSGSGGGRKNYILNPSAATDVSKWTASNFTVTKDTSTAIPRETTTGSAFKLVSTSTSATFLSDAMLLDDTDLSKKLGVEVAINIADSTNWTIDILAATPANKDILANYVRLPLSTDVASVTTLPATVGVFKTTVDTVAATPYLKFKITSAASDKTAYFSDIMVTPDGNTVVGAVIEEWKSYTPVLKDGSSDVSATYSSISGVYRRVGSGIQVRIVATKNGVGGSGGNGLTFGLPAGLSLDTTKMASVNSKEPIFGTGSVNLSGTFNATANSVIYWTTGSLIALALSATVYSQSDITANSVIRCDFTVPIAEWAGSGTVNLAQNDEEYSSNSDVSDATNNIAFAYGPAGSTVPSVTTDARIKRVRFQTPIQSSDKLFVEVSKSGGPWMSLAEATYVDGICLYQYQGTATTASYGLGVDLSSINGTDVNVVFGRWAGNLSSTYGGTGVVWSALAATYKWRVRKTSGGKAIGFSMADTNSAGLVSTQAQSFAGVKTFNDGIKLDDAAGQSILNYYALTSGSTAITGVSGTHSFMWNISRVGNTVTLHIKAKAIMTANAIQVYASALIPVGYRPTADCMFVKFGQVATTYKSVPLYINANGGVYIYPDDAQSNWSGQTVTFAQDSAVSWIIE